MGQFQVINNDLLPCCFRVRRNHRHMTDAGYGSRIGAASKMANAFVGKLNAFLSKLVLLWVSWCSCGLVGVFMGRLVLVFVCWCF